MPGEYEREYVVRLLENVVAPDGRLLVANYGEGLPNPERGLLPGCHPTRFLAERLEELRLKALRFCDGYDPIKDRRARVAVLSRESVLDAVRPGA